MADDLDIEAMLEAPYRKVRLCLSCVLWRLSAGLYCSCSTVETVHMKVKPDQDL